MEGSKKVQTGYSLHVVKEKNLDMSFFPPAPGNFSRDIALTRCFPAGSPVKVTHPEEPKTKWTEVSQKIAIMLKCYNTDRVHII